MWSVEDIKSLEDKIIIVTGGNSGLGYEDVKFYASNGATVIMASRSLERGEAAKEKILNELDRDNIGEINVMELDLASLASIDKFANEFTQSYNELHILMNNAGVMTTPYGLTKDGFEQQFGVNYLGHFVLTAKLFPVIKTTNGARIINISSNAHKTGNISFDNLMYDKEIGYTPMKAYSRSKLANLLFTYELQRRINQTVYDIRVLAAHPGVSNTDLARHVEGGFFFKKIAGVIEKTVQSAYEGALPGIRAALDLDAFGGEYFGPSGFMEMKGKPIRVDSNKLSHNKIVARRLWKVSEKLTGMKFDFS